MKCPKSVYCLIIRFICGFINEEDFIKTLKKNKNESFQTLFKNINTSSKETVNVIYDFLIERQMVPKYKTQYNIGIINRRSTPLSALFALHHSFTSDHKILFKEILVAQIEKFETCSAICLYINQNKWCFFNKERTRKKIEENEYCNFKTVFLNEAESTSSGMIKEINNNIGFKTLLQFGDIVNEVKKQNDKELYEYNLNNANKLNNLCNHFFVFRRFNSYTPILNTEQSVGGGYFFWTGIKGIVIDPGIDFIKNYINAGFPISKIDVIIVTHAHPDHTADLPNLLTLHFEQNDFLENNEKISNSAIDQDIFYPQQKENKKILDIYLNLSSYEYLNGIMNIDNSKVNYNIHILENGNSFIIDSETEIIALPTIHRDLLASNLGIGIVLRSIKHNFQIIYTSDTAVNNKLLINYEKILMENNLKTILLANIGGIHKNELNSIFFIDLFNDQNTSIPNDFHYPNHIGIFGLFKLIKKIKPKVVLLGEIGLEMEEYKIKLAESISTEIELPCLVADLGLTVNPENLTAFALSDEDKLVPQDLEKIKCVMSKEKDCLYVSENFNKENLNSSKYKDSKNIWIKNLPL